VLFWKSTAIESSVLEVEAVAQPDVATPAQVTPVMLALSALVVLSVFAGPVAGYLEQTSEQLFDRAGYISAVLAPGEEG
jgi:multicomponent K+:H+ antiporter subunit D